MVGVGEEPDHIRQLEHDVERLQSEIERYRDAADMALGQLEQAADYLASSGEGSIARALRANRNSIRRRMNRR
jgi:hypothetical protein